VDDKANNDFKPESTSNQTVGTERDDHCLKRRDLGKNNAQ
jgi:hypothetical protein